MKCVLEIKELNYAVYMWEFFNQEFIAHRQQPTINHRDFLQSELKTITQDINAELFFNDNGKPFIRSAYFQSISISHTLNYLVIQLHKENIAGIDIETQRPALVKVQQKFLNNDEINWAHNDIFNLCVLWTAKEALFKVFGTENISLKNHISINLQNYPYLIGNIKMNGKSHSFVLYSQQYEHLTLTYVVKKN
ncbi:MAG: hypothetical protein OHK0036_20780 [Bacteroidia bacterium]